MLTATSVTGPWCGARRIRAVTSTSAPVGSTHDCSGTPVRVTSPAYGLTQSTQPAPS
jgi:hypothetical protein